MKFRSVIFVGLALAATACAPIQNSAEVGQPVRQSLTAGVGDTILRADERKSLPNAFGRADIFGRTTTTGFTIVQFGGLQNGRVILLRSGTAIQSNATTMNSTPLLIPTQDTATVSGTVGGVPVYGTATSSGVAYIPPRGAQGYSQQQPTISIPVDWRRNPRVPISGRTIVIENASPSALQYRIE